MILLHAYQEGAGKILVVDKFVEAWGCCVRPSHVGGWVGPFQGLSEVPKDHGLF